MRQEPALITHVKPDWSTLGARLKWARERLKLSQVELAKRAKVKPGAIGNYESGAREQPRDIVALAKAAEVNVEWLNTGKGEPDLAGQHDAVAIAKEQLPSDTEYINPLAVARALAKLLADEDDATRSAAFALFSAIAADPDRMDTLGRRLVGLLGVSADDTELIVAGTWAGRSRRAPRNDDFEPKHDDGPSPTSGPSSHRASAPLSDAAGKTVHIEFAGERGPRKGRPK